jgi:hypothetical protein
LGGYLPITLPPITAVEIVILDGVPAPLVDVFHRMEGYRRMTLLGDQAQRIADLWRSLPPGEQSRCHIPPYGLRFFSADRVVCQASLCWQCNNVYGDADGQHWHFEFDGRHATSQELLTEIRRAIGDPD